MQHKLENPLHFKFWNYSGGEIGCRYISPKGSFSPTLANLTARLNSPDSLVKLVLAADALSRQPLFTGLGVLRIGYMPYARQDKIHADGDGLSLKAIASIIDNLGFQEIEILDPHSDVALACFNNTKVTVDDGSGYFQEYIRTCDKSKVVLVVPDAGAQKRVYKWAKDVGITNIIQALKHRDPVTGEIAGITVDDSLDSNIIKDAERILIADDICDRGGTFLGIAQALKTAYGSENVANKLYLYVTHGIFPDSSLEKLLGVFQGIGTTNTVRDFDLVTQEKSNIFVQTYF
jgi:ribose-phosphate pyrophosphokinase